jgi:1,4-alpha-glucan branching enzyme
MPSSSIKTAHKLGANRKETAHESRRARNSSESTDVREGRGTVKSKFSRSEPTTTRLAVPQRRSFAVHGGATVLSRLSATAGLLPEHSSGAEFHVAHLHFFREGARNVAVAGTFNDWKPKRMRLHQNGLGEWEVALSLAPGDYEYRFVVGGEWTDDPLSCRHVTNPFGGVNAVLHVHGN